MVARGSVVAARSCRLSPSTFPSLTRHVSRPWTTLIDTKPPPRGSRTICPLFLVHPVSLTPSLFNLHHRHPEGVYCTKPRPSRIMSRRRTLELNQVCFSFVSVGLSRTLFCFPSACYFTTRTTLCQPEPPCRRAHHSLVNRWPSLLSLTLMISILPEPTRATLLQFKSTACGRAEFKPCLVMRAGRGASDS
jgi:hypothetical protein